MHKKIWVLISMFVLYSCAGLLIGSDARQEFEKGLALFNAGNYEQAAPHFVKATELEPEFGRAGCHCSAQNRLSPVSNGNKKRSSGYIAGRIAGRSHRRLQKRQLSGGDYSSERRPRIVPAIGVVTTSAG